MTSEDTGLEYECALTGSTEAPGIEDDSDGLSDLPVGWTRIKLSRRRYNQKWLAIQQLKEVSVEGLLQQLPPESRDFQRYLVSLQIEAQFHSLEAATPMYESDEDTVYLSDSGEILASINEIRETLGLEPLSDDPSEDEEEGELVPVENKD